ncbi:MAG TPA: hypothetical protein VF680_07720 [Allosphingosinicella sp.]|jgi:hypothetical protein
MALAFLIALQAAAAVPPAAAAEAAAVDFDLAELTRRQQAEAEAGCGTRAAGEIVVCGRRPGAGDYDMEKWERIFREGPLVAETDLGGGATGRAYTEQVDLGGGMVSKRFMVGVKVPF